MENDNIVNRAISWQFLNEPFWKWFVFIIALGFAMNAWGGVLRYMKSK